MSACSLQNIYIPYNSETAGTECEICKEEARGEMLLANKADVTEHQYDDLYKGAPVFNRNPASEIEPFPVFHKACIQKQEAERNQDYGSLSDRSVQPLNPEQTAGREENTSNWKMIALMALFVIGILALIFI